MILALAFSTVINSLVADVITPIIAATGGQPNFDALVLDVGDGQVRYGVFINTVVSFLIIAVALFVIVKAYDAAVETAKRGGEEAATEVDEDVALLREIRDLLRQAPGRRR